MTTKRPQQPGLTRRFVVKSYVTATCAAEAIRKARKVAPDDVYSLESDKDGGGAPSGGWDRMSFLLFGGSTYYPSGGWEDFIGEFRTATGAMLAVAVAARGFDWAHIVVDGKIAATYSSSTGGWTNTVPVANETPASLWFDAKKWLPSW